MCLILFAWRAHPHFPLVVAANRDEYHGRATAPAQFWPDAPALLAGRDLAAGGTWIGVSRSGRFAAVTNYRRAGRQRRDADSRGALVADFLRGEASPSDYLRDVHRCAQRYNGFSLVVADRDTLCYCSNCDDDGPRELVPGIYGLSNSLLDVDWPKVRRGRAALGAVLGRAPPLEADALIALLGDERGAGDAELPDTGVGIDLERRLAPIFIRGTEYGTRCSTAIVIAGTRAIFRERSFAAGGEPGDTVRVEFELGGASR
ncbi:MAG: NRDE family protein [Gammaproteobacteria bacterium]|nr:NRDE family protein [Gammaproteobacteria bacterium]